MLHVIYIYKQDGKKERLYEKYDDYKSILIYLKRIYVMGKISPLAFINPRVILIESNDEILTKDSVIINKINYNSFYDFYSTINGLID